MFNIQGLDLRIVKGAKAPDDLRLDMYVRGQWVPVPMELGFLCADFFADNERYLETYRPSWRNSGDGYFMLALKRAIKYGWRPVAETVERQRRAVGALSLRRYTPMKQSTGTRIPDAVRRQVILRDEGCVGPRVGMPTDCTLGVELDHVRASGGLGMKSESTADNLVSMCGSHHRMKTLEGRRWRPRLLGYLATVDVDVRPGRG